jgi:hypothetical protein
MSTRDGGGRNYSRTLKAKFKHHEMCTKSGFDTHTRLGRRKGASLREKFLVANAGVNLSISASLINRLCAVILYTQSYRSTESMYPTPF